MIPDALLDLLTQRHTAIVAIGRPSGGPQLSPVWFVWDGEALWFRVARTTAKYRNIGRDPSISLYISDAEGFRYLVLSGQAEILDHNPRDIAVRIVNKYYAPALAPQRMPPDDEPDVVTVRLQPDKVVAVDEQIAREAVRSWGAEP